MSKHDCPTDFKNKQANRKWVVKMLEKILRCNPDIKHGQTVDLFKTECKVILDDNLGQKRKQGSWLKALKGRNMVYYGIMQMNQ